MNINIEKYLKDISMIDSKIDNKKYEREMWYQISQGTTGSSDGERVQSSGDQQKMASAVAKYTDIDREIEALKQMKIDFISKIEKLPRRYYMLMHDIYIKGLTLKEIARQNEKSDSWASTNHSRAKVELAKIIRGDKDV